MFEVEAEQLNNWLVVGDGKKEEKEEVEHFFKNSSWLVKLTL